jgi:V8-like Glu-specific endopeptidase
MARNKAGNRFVSSFVLSIVLVSIASAIGAQTLEERRKVNVHYSKNNQTIAPARRLTAAPARVPAAPLQVARIRVHLRLIAPPTSASAAWSISVQDQNGNEVESLPSSAFIDGEVWTGDVPGGQAVLRLSQTDAHVEVDKVAFEVTQDAPQAIVGNNDMKAIGDNAVDARIKKWAPAIARLRFMTPDGEAVCTGFLVGADLLMTNEHCIATPADASSARVEFGFDSAAASLTTFEVKRIEAVDAPLDYSLVRLKTSASKFGRLHFGTTAAPAKLSLVIVQHPGGQPKQVALPPNCSVGATPKPGVNGAPNDFGHVCDTMGGSSGSPVMESTNGAVVGLHHLGFLPGMTPENQAVHIGLIVKDLGLRVQNGTLTKATLDEVTLSAPPIKPGQ